MFITSNTSTVKIEKEKVVLTSDRHDYLDIWDATAREVLILRESLTTVETFMQ